MIQMSVQTLVVTNAPNPSILVLCPTEDFEKHRDCRIVPIWLGVVEASQLGMSLENAHFARPMTHDLMMNALTSLDATILRVEIVAQKEQTFYAHLILHQGDRTIELDARPSDAISLAVRQGAPIFMDEDVLQKTSFPFLFHSDKDDQEEIREFHSFVKNLHPDDFLE